MSSLITGFLQSPLPEKKAWLKQYFSLIHKTSVLSTNVEEWSLIYTLYIQLVDLGRAEEVNYVFFLTLAGNYSLQECADLSFSDANERLFFRNEWLPAVKRLTERLRIVNSRAVMTAKKYYVHACIQSWSLKVVAFENLHTVTPINLVEMSLPQIEDPSEHPL